jgi:hypothetical protein
VVLNFSPYLNKIHIGLNRPNSDLGLINPAALCCGAFLLFKKLISFGKSLIDPPTIGGGLVYPLNYETV